MTCTTYIIQGVLLEGFWEEKLPFLGPLDFTLRKGPVENTYGAIRVEGKYCIIGWCYRMIPAGENPPAILCIDPTAQNWHIARWLKEKNLSKSVPDSAIPVLYILSLPVSSQPTAQ